MPKTILYLQIDPISYLFLYKTTSFEPKFSLKPYTDIHEWSSNAFSYPLKCSMKTSRCLYTKKACTRRNKDVYKERQTILLKSLAFLWCPVILDWLDVISFLPDIRQDDEKNIKKILIIFFSSLYWRRNRRLLRAYNSVLRDNKHTYS